MSPDDGGFLPGLRAQRIRAGPSHENRAVSRAATRNNARQQTSTFEDPSLDKNITPPDVLAARRASVIEKQIGTQPLPYGSAYTRRKLLTCPRPSVCKRKKLPDQSLGPVLIDATVNGIGAYMAMKRREARWNIVIDPRNSRFMSVWDVIMLVTIGLLSIITPFEVAFIAPSSNFDVMFWLNRSFGTFLCPLIVPELVVAPFDLTLASPLPDEQMRSSSSTSC